MPLEKQSVKTVKHIFEVFMKKYTFILSLITFVSASVVNARNISFKAWTELRDVHAAYIEQVEGEKWKSNTSPIQTDKFLCETIKPFFMKTWEENQKLKEEKQTLEEKYKTLEGNESTAKIYLIVIIVMGIVLLGGPLLFCIFIIKFQKKNQVYNTPVSEDICPRCGGTIDPSKKECTNCKTRV